MNLGAGARNPHSHKIVARKVNQLVAIAERGGLCGAGGDWRPRQSDRSVLPDGVRVAVVPRRCSRLQPQESDQDTNHRVGK